MATGLNRGRVVHAIGDGESQNALGRPASFVRILFARWRDGMVAGTVNGLSVLGLTQIS
jgi:hypothetical protein